MRTRLAGSREASCSSRPARWPRRPRRRHGCRRAIRSPVISRRWCSGVPSRLACCRMVDSGGGIDIQGAATDRDRGRAPARARWQPGYRAEGRIDQPPNRGRRGGGADDAFPITAPLCPTPALQSAPPATARPDPRTPDPARRSMAPVGIRQHHSDLRRQPGQLRHLAQHPHSAVRHTMPESDTLTRETAAPPLHLRSAFSPATRKPREVPLMQCRTGTFAYLPTPISAISRGIQASCPTATRWTVRGIRRSPPPPPRR